MSKFNSATQKWKKTLNHEGAITFRMNEKERLMTQVLTSLFNESKYYGDNSKSIVQNIRNVLEVDAKFVANLALYTRNEMHLRSISHVLAAEIANSKEGKAYAKDVVEIVVERADDMMEILSYYINTFGKPIPNSLKKGLANSFAKFDEYQLAKYNRANSIKLKDILCLTHPKAKDEAQSNLWKRVLEDTLETPVTWETELSKNGNTKEAWEKLIQENKLGYMAMLRNLRNILNSGAEISKVYSYLTNEYRILKNKQLPFRYYSAYKVLKENVTATKMLYAALEFAIKTSTTNISRLKGKTYISADVSGSMDSRISAKSDMTCAEIAVLMLSIANYICDQSITTTFDTELYSFKLETRNGIISNANSISVNGGGTDITLPIRHLVEKNIFVDRIIILSDNEINRRYTYSIGYGGPKTCQEWVEEYKRKVNPDVWVHAIDLQGYGTQQFVGENVNIIAGWSEKVFEFINLAEQGRGKMIDKIQGYFFE